MKKQGSAFTYLILWLLLIGTVLIISGMNKKPEGEPAKSPQPTTAPVNAQAETPPPAANEANVMIPDGTPQSVRAEGEDLVGIWIPYMSLQTAEGTEEAFKLNFERMVGEAKRLKVNSLFVHVRPFGDAFYPSSYFPWSHILTGTQGQDPGFDPLQYMIETTHANGMEFHGWINPLRIKLSTVPDPIAAESPYTKWAESNPYYFLNVDGSIFLNPAYKEVRTLIADGAKEIVEKYDVDGIHFDDYFYPEAAGDTDAQAYTAYTDSVENPLSLEEWRISNINTLIAQVYRTIKETKPDVVFGISPQGNVNNNRALGADVFSWVSTKGYVDYIMPQIYFSYENPALGFTPALESWLNLAKHEDLKIYIGLALYKAGTESDSGTWKGQDDMIARQIEEVRGSGCDGYVLYDIGSMGRPEAVETVAAIEKLAPGT